MIKPIRDRILIKPTPVETKTESGLYIPDTASDTAPEKGTVISVGSGRVTQEGKIISFEVAEGNIVLYPKGAGVKTKSNGDDLIILTEDQILAIVE